MFNEGNQIHNLISSSGSGTVINYGSGSDFLTSYGSGSGSTSQKITVPTVPVPVPQHWYSEQCPLDGHPLVVHHNCTDDTLKIWKFLFTTTWQSCSELRWRYPESTWWAPPRCLPQLCQSHPEIWKCSFLPHTGNHTYSEHGSIRIQPNCSNRTLK
jgi:hypothetical protein